MLPKRAMTFGASVLGMWMIWLTSRLKVKPSDDRTVIVDRFLSRLCASDLPVAQFRTTFAVGTTSTLCVYGLIGYFPGSSGWTHTPFSPLDTRLPCLKESPVTSTPSPPDIRNDDPDVRDRNLGHLLDFHGRKSGVDEVAARQQHLLLQALAPAVVRRTPADPGTCCVLRLSRPAIVPLMSGAPSFVVTMPTMLSGISVTSSIVTVNSFGLMRYWPCG
jgi:hypothetical protein